MTRTVSTLSSVKLASYRKALHARKSVKKGVPARLTQARKVARKAISILRKKFEVEKVVLFGSIVKPALFHSRSDVDIAVWGLDESKYFRAVGVLQGIDPAFSIDLISFETASPTLQEVIRRDGKAL